MKGIQWHTPFVFAREQVVEGNFVQTPVMILDTTLKACEAGGNKAIVKPRARFRNKEWWLGLNRLKSNYGSHKKAGK